VAGKTCPRRSRFLDSREGSSHVFSEILGYQMCFLMQNNSSERGVEVLYIPSEKTLIVKTVVTEEQHIILDNMFFGTRNTIRNNN